MKKHSPRFLTLVTEAKKRIKEITPQVLKEKINQHQTFSLIDVRDDKEWLTGHIPTATHISKGVIERDIEKELPDPTTLIVVYCSGGFRCALVADSLQNMGYNNVYSLQNGSQGWIDAGYRLEEIAL